MILSGNGPAEPPSASNASAARLSLLGQVGLPRFHDHLHRLHGNRVDRAFRTCRLRRRCGLMILRAELAYASRVGHTRPCRPTRWSWTNPNRSTWRCPPSRRECLLDHLRWKLHPRRTSLAQLTRESRITCSARVKFPAQRRGRPKPHPELWTPPGCQAQSATHQADQRATRARPARAARSSHRCAADRHATTSGVRAA